MQISPNVSMWINAIIAVLAAIAGGAISLTDLVPPGPAHLIMSWSAFIVSVYGVINAVLHGASSSQPGPLNGGNPPPVNRMLMCIVALAGLLVCLPVPARAEPGGHPSPNTGPRMSALPTLNQLHQKLQQVTLADLEAADKIALAHGNQISHACWQAWMTEIKADLNANLGPDGKPIDIPSPHLIVDFERMIDLSNALQPNSAFSVACAPLAQQVKMNMFNLIGAAAAGSLVVPFAP